MVVPTSSDLSAQLDSEIATLKSQIAQIRAKKSALTSALLANPRVVRYAANRPRDTFSDVLDQNIADASRDQATKFYRTVTGVTAFPFTDPSPERADDPACLGVRFDVPADNTLDEDLPETQSYFVILQRTPALKLQTRTVPKHINVEGYAMRFLSEGYADGADLHAFVEAVHADLRAWQYRKRGVALVKRVQGEFGVRKVESTSDAREVRISWHRADGVVRVGYDGSVVGAAVFGKRSSDAEEDAKVHESVRLVEWERILFRSRWSEKTKAIDDLPESLRMLWNTGLVGLDES